MSRVPVVQPLSLFQWKPSGLLLFFFCPFQIDLKTVDGACSGFADRSENGLTVWVLQRSLSAERRPGFHWEWCLCTKHLGSFHSYYLVFSGTTIFASLPWQLIVYVTSVQYWYSFHNFCWPLLSAWFYFDINPLKIFQTRSSISQTLICGDSSMRTE